MNDEWYEYAISISKRTNNKIKKISDWMIYFILAFFSLPLLIRNIWGWLILTTIYSLSLFYNSHEKDNYAKALFDIGINVLVLAIAISSAVAIFSNNEKFVVFPTLIGLIFYEISVLIKVRLKKYSTCSKNNFTTLSTPVILGIILFGRSFGQYLISNNNISVLSLLVSIVGGTFIVFSITFLQKYIVYKIIKKTKGNNHNC